MEQGKKKLSNAQLERRMKDAIVFVPRDKSCKEIFFDDKGLRLQVTDNECVISTAFHRHVFAAVTANGYSRPYLYTKRFVDIALENDCVVTDKNGNAIGHSYKLLMDILKAKEDKAEYNIATYFDWWSFNCFQPLYGIDENAASQWLVYLNYMHNIAVNSILLDELKEDMTNVDFTKRYLDLMADFTKEIEPNVILHKPTDEEVKKENAEAMQEEQMEQALQNEQENG